MGRRGLLVSCLLAAGVVAAAACVDGFGPRRAPRANLAFYPVFEGYGPQDGVPADVDSFVITVNNPPRAPFDTVVRVVPGQTEIVIDLTVPLSGSSDTMQVTFNAYNSTTGLRLYSGTQEVVARINILTEPAPVNAAYVGPGRNLRTLEVLPVSAALQPGQTVQLTYTGFDSAGTAMPDDSVPVRYRSRDTLVAVVSSGGEVFGRANGTTKVDVIALASSSIRDSVDITVSSAPPPLIGLSRTSLTFNDTLSTANPQAQTVEVTNSGGGVLSGLAVGAITYGSGASGWLSASLNNSTAPATLTVSASLAGLTAGTFTAQIPITASGVSNSPQTVSVTFNVTAAPIAAIVTAPGFAVLRPGEQVALTVDGRNASGQSVPVSGVSFTSRAPGVATVNASTGQVTAVAGGAAVIVATAAGFSDSTLVVVAANGASVVSAIADGRNFGRAKVGDTVRVLVAMDMRGVAPELLGSYNAQLNWASATLRFVRSEAIATGLQAPLVNPANASAGELRFGAADPNGLGGSFQVLRVVYVAQAAGTTDLTLGLTDLSAAITFADLLPGALRVSGMVRVQ
ncbi:MAG TPA: Ig-like domain-containing protein [Gemmatimonadales bacterium]|nr:Ig-like domain-containing protein [Gemmatimonadales bacterium]